MPRLLSLFAWLPLAAAAAAPAKVERVFPHLSFAAPLFLTAAPGDRQHLYVETQDGRVFEFKNAEDPTAANVFLDIRKKVAQRGGEEGLLGLAFHPDYAKNGLLYVYYTAAGIPRRSVIARYHAQHGGAADAASEKVLLVIPQPYANHNGGMLAFGPDRMLYVGLGDGGGAGDPENRAQDLGTLLGKILRLDDNGAPAPDNPFVETRGARPEIWAYGLRNPWRFSFDRKSGELWAGDVGQNSFEEIDRIVRGGNYGWRLFEGTHEFNNPQHRPAKDFAAPVLDYGRKTGQCVTGGYVYRGKALRALRGDYVYADFGAGTVWALGHHGTPEDNRVLGEVPQPTSFGEDSDGELYLTSYHGEIYKVLPP